MKEQNEALKNKALVLMFLRAVLALAFLGITTWLQVREYSFSYLNPYPLYAIVVLIGSLTLVYALVLKWVKNLRLFIYLQVTLDILIITLTVYVTGGLDSYLQVLYFLSIIGGAILLSKRGGYYAASLSSIAYGVLIDLDFYSLLPLKYKIFPSYLPHRWDDAITTIATNTLAFFTVALLTGYLAGRTERVEQRLQEQSIDFDKLARLNEYIVENITSGIMTIDKDLRITSFNRAAETITGYSLRDVYYRKVDEILPGVFSAENILSAETRRLEKTVRVKDGKEVVIGFRFSRGSGMEDAHIIIFQDLSKMRSMEEQLRRAEKMRALGELSVGIAHEVRNPLASISGSIQVLKEQLRLEGDDLSLMDIVLRETNRLNELITDFLLFARPAHQRRGVLDLKEILDEKIRLFRNSGEAGAIEIENRLEGNIMVFGDARQLGQVFWNIFLNSAQAMEEGKGRIIITSWREGLPPSGDDEGGGSEPRPAASISIRDTGRGMAREELSRIFDPFYSSREGGTGLGLAIAHSIVESHNGRISVRSEPGKGAEFIVTLPLAASLAMQT